MKKKSSKIKATLFIFLLLILSIVFYFEWRSKVKTYSGAELVEKCEVRADRENG